MPDSHPWDEDVALPLVASVADEEGPLLLALQTLQDHFGYVPPQSLDMVAECLNVSRAEVLGVLSFYPALHREPVGSHVLQVCRAEACQAVGGRELEAAVKRHTGLDFHNTNARGSLTLEPVYCLGNCACGPSVRLDDRIFGRVDEQRLAKILRSVEEDAGK